MSRPGALAAVVLAFAGHWILTAADVGDFTPCLHFFYRSWPPKGLAGTPICQRYDNLYRFATLYSRARRSPWFSAYLYSVPAGKRPSASWKFEPQVRTGGRLPRIEVLDLTACLLETVPSSVLGVLSWVSLSKVSFAGTT